MMTYNTTINYQYTDDNQTYLKAIIAPGVTNPYLPFLEKILGQAVYTQYTQNQQHRDNFTHHMTVINPQEFAALPACALDVFIGYPLHIAVLGIGGIQEPDNATYFLVCRCAEANRLRVSQGLNVQDLHITLGFKQHDIFDKPKDASTLVPPFALLETSGSLGTTQNDAQNDGN